MRDELAPLGRASLPDDTRTRLAVVGGTDTVLDGRESLQVLDVQARRDPASNQRNVSILGIGYYEAAHLQRSLDLMLRRRDRYPFDRIVSDIFLLEEVENVLAEQNKGHITRAALKP